MVVWRVLKRLGISRKKKRSTPRSENPPKFKRNVKNGLATLCIGGGMGIAMCVQRD